MVLEVNELSNSYFQISRSNYYSELIKWKYLVRLLFGGVSLFCNRNCIHETQRMRSQLCSHIIPLHWEEVLKTSYMLHADPVRSL